MFIVGLLAIVLLWRFDTTMMMISTTLFCLSSNKKIDFGEKIFDDPLRVMWNVHKPLYGILSLLPLLHHPFYL